MLRPRHGPTRSSVEPSHDEKWEAGTRAEFRRLADFLLDFGYLPRGRFAGAPSYLFLAMDQTERMRRLLAARS
jgi:hypothetical protein